MKKILTICLAAFIAFSGCKEKPCKPLKQYENDKGIFTIDLETGDTIGRILKIFVNDSTLHLKDHLIDYSQIANDFDFILNRVNLNIRKGKLDSAMYYAGQMDYNIKIRARYLNFKQ